MIPQPQPVPEEATLERALLRMRASILVALLRKHGDASNVETVEKMTQTMTDADIVAHEIQRMDRPWWKRVFTR